MTTLEISREEIVAGLRNGTLTLVDVLPAESYRSGHIPGAISLPVGEIERRAAQVLPDREREIAVYCGGFT